MGLGRGLRPGRVPAGVRGLPPGRVQAVRQSADPRLAGPAHECPALPARAHDLDGAGRRFAVSDLVALRAEPEAVGGPDLAGSPRVPPRGQRDGQDGAGHLARAAVGRDRVVASRAEQTGVGRPCAHRGPGQAAADLAGAADPPGGGAPAVLRRLARRRGRRRGGLLRGPGNRRRAPVRGDRGHPALRAGDALQGSGRWRRGRRRERRLRPAGHRGRAPPGRRACRTGRRGRSDRLAGGLALRARVRPRDADARRMVDRPAQRHDDRRGPLARRMLAGPAGGERHRHARAGGLRPEPAAPLADPSV
jgi:hypothetical protein